MADPPHFPMSQQSRARLQELLGEASSLGLDPEAVTAGGPVALRALLAVKKAAACEPGSRRNGYIAQIEDALRVLQNREHPELVKQLQARVMALRGRGRDTEIAHVTRGEIVVPLQLQNDEVLAALRRAAEPYGVPLEMIQVGNALNHINPGTGAPEFGVMDWIAGLFKSEKLPSTTADEDQPNITIVPPFEDPAIQAEEIEAARQAMREHPLNSNPVLRAVGRVVQPIDNWLNEDERKKPPPSWSNTVRG